MGLVQDFLNGRQVKNAVQEQQGLNHLNGYNDSVYTRNIDYNALFFDGTNKAGRYDNYYGDASRIISQAAQHPFFYVDKDNDVVEDTEFTYYLDKPNANYPGFKVREQIIAELITHGHSDIFLWRKDGKKESRVFDLNKKLDENLFRGFTLVSGYDYTTLSKADKENIVRITLGANQANVFLGYSPSQAAQSWRGMQDEMGLHMTAFARNAGMPLGKFIITAPSPEDYAKMREKLDDKISGAKNNGKIIYDYRPSDSKVTQIEWVQFTSQDVQDYTNQLDFSEKKITQGFGVPGTIKGTNDSENYATARVSEQVFMKYTIKPLVESLKEQLAFFLEQRFSLSGQIKVNVPIPEIADESKVKIEATQLQVALFDTKIAEGYTPESIVAAYGLPESFLLLEKGTSAQNKTKTATKGAKRPKNELYRHYQAEFTEADRKDIEDEYRKITRNYANDIIDNGFSEDLREDYEGKMSAEFGNKYEKFYEKNLDDVADALVAAVGTVDIDSLNLTDEELAEARKRYDTRVNDFSKTFAEGIEKLEGETLEVKKTNAESHIERVVVTESEHTRIVSELDGWTKSEKEFPVRVYKTWKALPSACPECAELHGTSIDVTSLFIKNPSNEIYEVQGGGLHPNCRCIVTYEMDAESVRKS